MSLNRPPVGASDNIGSANPVQVEQYANVRSRLDEIQGVLTECGHMAVEILETIEGPTPDSSGDDEKPSTTSVAHRLGDMQAHVNALHKVLSRVREIL